jgi:hypothetical protein
LITQEVLIEALKNSPGVITAITAVVSAVIALRGLNRWRAEAIGKRKAELAEDVLASFYQLRDIMTFARRTAARLARQAWPSWPRLTTPSPLWKGRQSGHCIVYTLRCARLANPKNLCRKAGPDLSAALTASSMLPVAIWSGAVV